MIVDVAVAVIQQANSAYLLAQRPQGKPYAGYWEFPGGKIESHESPLQALHREIKEELDIEIEFAYPWISRVFSYQHATVRLKFFRVRKWHGEPRAREAQQLSWQQLDAPVLEPLLPANYPIVKALHLPHICAISNVQELGREQFLERAARAIDDGLRLIVFREEKLAPTDAQYVLEKLKELAGLHGVKLLVHSTMDIGSDICDGIHLTSSDLKQLTERPSFAWVGASCHNAEELARAAHLNLDFALLSPVLPTASHPNASTLGWAGFAQLIKNYALPVYALGGMKKSLLEQAMSDGAQGIAMLRDAW